MAKQLNVNLAFTADASQAKAQLQDLQKQLSNLVSVKTTNKLGLTAEIQEASRAAAQLKVQLQSATDSTTGKLDLSKFNASLKQSNMTLAEYQSKLNALGPVGKQAFSSLAQSVLQAEVSLKRSNGLLSQFATSLANTARWQISSSILHGFMSTTQQAYRYAQDLNESLNNIRIVTGQNVDQMAKFADQANRAAKELSTTTTAYTNASLIYYQQGLNDQQVKERTDITVKMANVARQSAETVSDQMTAVWNNFYDGSKSLEYYADVMTALGAATASSTDEISEGLNKFAAVAETVGLSYEYAASALATITSNTRESADVVGNALKTLFARIQGLKLGETLEDGVDLNKYSKALDTVGIKVLDANGELKAMDILLEELAAKWDTIGTAEQTALAQTVAGVRQYTQLIALMENWDNGDSDSMTANLATAYDSTGALQEQADIYAESWEAAGKRVKASAQDIYDSILDDKFFIKITDGFADFLDIISNTVDALGGMKGVLSGLGGILLMTFGPQLSANITNFVNKLKFTTEEAKQMKLQTAELLSTSSMIGSTGTQTEFQQVSNGIDNSVNLAYQQRGTLQIELINNAKNLTQEEQSILQIMFDQNAEAIKLATNLGQAAKEAIRIENSSKAQLKGAVDAISKSGNEEAANKIRMAQKKFDTATQKERALTAASGIIGDLSEDETDLKRLQITVKQLKESLKNTEFANLIDVSDDEQDIAKLQAAIKGIRTEASGEKITEQINAATSAAMEMEAAAQGTGVEKYVSNYVENVIDGTIKTSEFAEELGRTNRRAQSLGEGINQAGKKVITFGEKITSVATAITAVSMAINNIKGLKDIWTNEDLSTGEKVLSTLSSMAMVVPMLTNAFSGLNAKQLLAAGSSIAAKIGMTGVATSASAAAAATSGFGMALITTLWPLALVAAAIGGLIALFIALDKQAKANSANGQLKTAKNTAQELKEELNETIDYAEKLKSVFDDYTSVEEKLESCTKGTEEWQEALDAVNTKVLEILALYPSLMGMMNDAGEFAVIKDDSGKWTIQDWAIDQMINDSQAAITQARVASLSQDNLVTQLTPEATKENILSQVGKTGDDGMAAWSNEDGTLAANDITQNLLTDISLAARENFDDFAKVTNAEQFQSFINEKRGYEMSAVELQHFNELIAPNFEKNFLPQLIAYGQQESQANVSSKTANNLVASEIAKNEKLSNKVNADKASEAASATYDEEYRTEKEKVKLKSGGEKAFNDYLDQMGLSDKGYQFVSKDGSGNNREFKYKDEQGKEHTINIDQMKSNIASKNAQEIATDKAIDYSDTFEKLSEKGADFAALAANNTSESFTDYLAKNFTADQLTQLTDGEMTTEDAQLLGFENLEQLNTVMGEFGQTAADLGPTLQEASKQVTELDDNQKANIENLKTENATQQELIDFSRSKDKLKESLDEKDFETSTLSEIEKENADNVSGLTDFYSGLQSIDFESAEAASKILELANSCGVSGEAVDQLIGEVDALDKVFSISTANIQEEVGSLKEIADGLSTGDTISAEDLKTLENAGIETSNYFSLMYDGTYALTTSAEQFNRMVNEISFDKFEAEISKFQSAESQAIENSGYHLNEGEIFDKESILNNEAGVVPTALEYIKSFDPGTINVSEEQQALLDSNPHEYNAEELQMVVDMMDQLVGKQAEVETQALSLATSLGELNSMASQLGTVTNEGYGNALINLASQYGNCTEEINAHRAALASDNAELIASTEIALAAATSAAEQANMYDLNANEIEDISDAFLEMAESGEEQYQILKEDGEALTDAAVRYMRLNEAIEDLYNNYDDYSDVLEEVQEAEDDLSKASAANTKTAQNLKKSLASLIGTSEDFVDVNLLDAIDPEDFKAAAEGDVEAIERIRDEFVRLQAEANGIDFEGLKSELDGLAEGEVFDIDLSGYLGQLIQAKVAAGATAAEIQSLLSGFNIDATVTDFHGTLAEAEAQSAGTAEVITNNLSYDQEVQTVTQDTPTVEQEIEYETTYTPTAVPYNSKVLKSGAEEAVTIPESRTSWKKTVTPAVKETPKTDQVVGKSVKTKSAGGAEGKTSGVKIENAHKSSGGRVSPSNTGRSAGGGGGGGGGGGSKPKDTKKASDEIERYHEIKEVISDLTREYDRINKARTRAFGMDAVKLMDQEIKKTEEMIEAQKKYLKEIETNRDSDQSALAAYGAVFDSEGRIANYDEIMSQQLEKFNASRTEEAEKAYEEFKKILEQYEETQNLLEEEEAKLEDYQNQLYDQKLEKVDIEVQLKLSLEDDTLKYLEFLMEQLESQAYDVAEAFALLGQEASSYQNQINIAQNGINDILANHDIAPGTSIADIIANGEQLGLTADEIDKLREYRDTIMSSTQALMQLRQVAIEKVTNAFDSWNEKFTSQIDILDHYTSVMESFANIVDIVGKETLGITDEMMKNWTQASVENSINTLTAQRKRVDALRREEENLRQQIESETNEEKKKMLQEALDHIIAETNAAEEDMMAQWEATLEAAAEAFEQAVDTTISAFEKALSGTYGSLDGLQTAFDQASEIADRYVDDYKEIYELNKLNRDITNSIDDTDNIKAKKALRDLQKEIVALQEDDVQMSEYDLEHLRAKYELRLAEIALEEAQNAKSQVRMRKDSEGNYSYVFTADASAVEKAQQDYEDKLYEMQELNSEYIKEMQNNILQSEIELANALRELDKAKFKSDEEYYAEVNRLTQYYTGQRNYYLDEMNKGITNNQETVNEDWKNYSDATGYKMSADKDYVDSFDETILAQLTGYRSIEDAQNRFADATSVMVEDLRTAFRKWQENTESAMQAAGTSIENFGRDVNKTIYGEGDDDKGIVGASDDVIDKIEDIADEMADAFGPDAMQAFADFAQNYIDNIMPMIEANKTLIEQLNDLIELEADLNDNPEDEIPDDEPEEDEPENETPPSGPTNPHGKPSALTGLYQNYTERAGVKAIQHALKEMGYNLGSYGIDGKYGSTTAAAVRQFQKDNGITTDGIVGDETRAKFKAKGYLTGGLVQETGWAWLDGTPSKPEYVLSGEQTDAFIRLVDDLHYLNELNKLASVQEKGMMMIDAAAKDLTNSIDFINDIMRVIDLNAGMQSIGFGGNFGISAMDSEPILQQDITIHAEFPEATDRNEIEAAFDSLFLRASQFANRKN